MKLLVVHGAPGVGKYTVASELVSRTGFRLLHYHAFGACFGPLFGFGSPEFLELRDRLYPEVLRAAAHLDGVVATFIFEPTVDVPALEAVWDEIGADLFFVGLTCDAHEHRRRVETRDRGKLGGAADFAPVAELLAQGVFAFPDLPGPAITIDTTSMAPSDVAATALRALPAGWLGRDTA